MSDLNVIAIITAKEGSEDIVRDALTTLAAATRAEEEGCLDYQLSVSAASPQVFLTVERWTDGDALEGHMSTPHIQAAIGAVGDHLAKPFEVHPLTPVEN